MILHHGAIDELVTPRGTLRFNQWRWLDSYLHLTGIGGGAGATLRREWDPAPQRDGAILHDAYRGARLPVLEGVVVAPDPDSAQALYDDLVSFTDSIMRADGTLKFTPRGEAQRQITVQLADAVQVSGDRLKRFQVALVAADPAAYSVLDDTVTSSSLALQNETGSLALPFPLPFTFGDFAVGGTVTATNDGNATSYPTVKIHGACSAPVVKNITTGKLISFPTLSISSGDYVQVDMQRRTVLLNGQSSSPYVRYLDVVTSDFWGLDPGANSIRLNAATFDASAKAAVTWRDAWV